jgi:hypothetical protein
VTSDQICQGKDATIPTDGDNEISSLQHALANLINVAIQDLVTFEAGADPSQ